MAESDRPNGAHSSPLRRRPEQALAALQVGADASVAGYRSVSSGAGVTPVGQDARYLPRRSRFAQPAVPIQVFAV